MVHFPARHVWLPEGKWISVMCHWRLWSLKTAENLTIFDTLKSRVFAPICASSWTDIGSPPSYGTRRINMKNTSEAWAYHGFSAKKWRLEQWRKVMKKYHGFSVESQSWWLYHGLGTGRHWFFQTPFRSTSRSEGRLPPGLNKLGIMMSFADI